MASFLFSGVLHELAISVPVRAGYGGPLFYFALQGALVLVEHGLGRAGSPIERLDWHGRVWTLGWLALPALLPPAVPQRSRLADPRDRGRAGRGPVTGVEAIRPTTRNR